MMKDYSVSTISYDQAREWILHKHYAKRMPSVSYAFGLFKNQKLIGICSFGMPPISAEFFRKFDTLELNRVVLNDNHLKNITSYFISQCFKLLPKPLLLLSYADPNQGHIGYIYQATNWFYTGLGGIDKEYQLKNKTYTIRHIKKSFFESNNLLWNDNKTISQNWINNGGKIINKKLKRRYVYFLGSKKTKKQMQKMLPYPILPYPKGESKRYDTSKPLIKKGLLY